MSACARVEGVPVKGDNAEAKEFAAQAAAFNSLPQLNHAFVRAKGRKMASG